MDLSVIIPSRDRRSRLLATVKALARQRLDGLAVELIVVENGADGGGLELDWAELSAAGGLLEVRLLQERRVGASAARNRAMAVAGSDVVLFLGDDTPPAHEGLLSSHVKMHRGDPDPLYAVLGRCEWDPEIEITEFMRWLPEAGFQNAFDDLEPGLVSPITSFFTSHVSAKRSLLTTVGGFDEDFPFYFEHVELGIRLQDAGMRLEYHPELTVHHSHAQTLEGFIERMRGVGSAARLLHERWPERSPAEVKGPSARWRVYPLADVLAVTALRLPVPQRLRERSWGIRLMAAYARGYRSSHSRVSPP